MGKENATVIGYRGMFPIQFADVDTNINLIEKEKYYDTVDSY